MSDLIFRGPQCSEDVLAGGGWVVERLVRPGIIAAASEGKPIEVISVLACREYLGTPAATGRRPRKGRDTRFASPSARRPRSCP
jgi:hypothetical protein